jgi:hypothetical protein
MTRRYLGITVSFLTQHGKESLVAPLLEPALGCHVVRAQGYDTDLLGTFVGDIPRPNTQLQTARRKARLGMELSGASVGMASEGAFVADPFGGLMPWNIELVVWLDDVHQLEIVGKAQGPACNQQAALRSVHDLEKFATAACFPSHQLVLRPQSDSDSRMYKGLKDWDTLKAAFQACLEASNNELVYAESDLRAFCNPTRQAMIQRATQDLLMKVQSACPVCKLPGFSIVRHRPGLPCRQCLKATQLALSHTWCCHACGHHVEKSARHAFAEPERCDHCNP